MCVYVYAHALAQVASLACDDPAAFSMNSACDLEIGVFVEQWQFCDFARTAIENVPAAIRSVVLRTFDIYRKPAADSDAEFIRHAMGIFAAWSDGLPLHAESVSRLILAHGLNPAAMHKLSLLPEALAGLVIRSFDPKGDRSNWSARFVAHASAIQRAWINRAVDAHRSRDRRPCGGARSDEPFRQVQSTPAGATSRNI